MLPSVSVIVPTFQEADNLSGLLEALRRLKEAHQLGLEVLIMDDNSQDGTEAVVQSLNLPWVRLITRQGDRGLSQAVIEGFQHAENEAIVVMDADLSHPVEKIPEMLSALAQGDDFVIGSRFVNGASIEETWGAFRWLNSKVASLIASPFTQVKDPMSGFFAFRKTLLAQCAPLNPVGYKIGLELLVKSHCSKVREIPIHFANRQHGQSKLSWREQFKYLQHVRRLYLYRYPESSYLLQFLVVGFLGVGVNLAVLTLALWAGVPVKLAIILGIAVSMVFNFALDRRFTFSYARHGKISQQFVGFVAVCLIGSLLNYLSAIWLLKRFPHLLPQLAELVGIVVGTFFNYSLSRFLIFRKDITR